MGIVKKKNILNVLCFVTLLLFLGVTFIQSARRAAQRFAGDFFFPFLAMPVKGQQEVSNRALLLESKNSLAQAVEKSERLNLRLSAEISAFSSLGEENAELRRLLALKKRVSYKFVFAEIILRDPTAWEQRFSIDKGARDGIECGDIVVAGVPVKNKLELAVVGRIASVTDHASEVNTLVNSEIRLSMLIPDNDAGGIIKDGFRRDGKLYSTGHYLPRDFLYASGMRVVTSGLSRNTPPGLYIGRIADDLNAVRNYKNLYKNVDIELGADLGMIHFVMVISGR